MGSSIGRIMCSHGVFFQPRKIVHVDEIFFATFTVALQKPPAVQAADGNAPGTSDFSFHLL